MPPRKLPDDYNSANPMVTNQTPFFHNGRFKNESRLPTGKHQLSKESKKADINNSV